MADVKWIKITTDVFDDEKILLIETLPEADSIIVIWFKLLCLAGKQNNSGVFMMNNQIPYTDKMLATIFRRKEATVQLALQTFEQFGMIEIVDGVITIPNWGKHQTLDSYENKKAYMKNYMKEYREKQKALVCKTNSKTNSKANVRQADKDIDKNKNKINNINIIVDYLNEKSGTSYRASSKTTQSHINARLSEGYTVDDFKIVIDKQCSKWKGTEYEQYLRPSTLFGTKFENYLNGKTTQPNTSDKNDGWCFTPNEDSLDDLF